MSTLHRLVTLLLLLWLPITLATAGGLRACPAHQTHHSHPHTVQMKTVHHHSMNMTTAVSHHGHDCNNHDNGNCTNCVMCHIPASLPQALTVTQPSAVITLVSPYFTDHYRSIASPPAERPPLHS